MSNRTKCPAVAFALFCAALASTASAATPNIYLDGNPRILNTRLDIGTYEYQGTAPPAVIYVDGSAAGANNGSNWANAFTSLQDALAAASNGNEIRVAQGTYRPDHGVGITQNEREATFQLKTNVTTKGGYAGLGEPAPDARNGQQYQTILSSGGIYYHDSAAKITNCTFTGNDGDGIRIAKLKWIRK